MATDQNARADAPVVAVIGGGGGIGVAAAAAFGRRGYRVALVDVDAARLARAIDSLGPGAATTGYACDIVDTTQVSATMNRLLAEHGRLDALVHAAGLTHVSSFLQTDHDVIRRVFEVNFFAVASITRAALPALIARRGQIAVLSSVCGFAPLVGRTGYCASKYALHGLFDTLRCELRTAGVSVTMVCPSFAATDFATRGLAGDGSTLAFARTTTGTPLAPQAIGEALAAGTLARRRLLVLSPQGKLSYWLSRLAPRWYERQMLTRFAGATDLE